MTDKIAAQKKKINFFIKKFSLENILVSNFLNKLFSTSSKYND